MPSNIKLSIIIINHHIISFHSSWLHYDAGRLSMPAQQLISSAIRIDCTPCRGNPNHMAHTPPEAHMRQPFPSYPKVQDAPTEPLGLCPHDGLPSRAPSRCEPSAPQAISTTFQFDRK